MRALLLALGALLFGALLFGCDGGGGGGGTDAGPMGACGRPREGEACATYMGRALPFHMSGSTSGASAFGGASCGGGGDGAPEFAFSWTPPAAGSYRISSVGSTFDTLLYARRGAACGGEELGCNDDAFLTGGASELLVALADCETITVVVDGKGAASGAFQIAITATETACDDGVDNDADGDTDCDDRECLYEAGCEGQSWIAFEQEVLRLTNERRVAGDTCQGVAMPPVAPLELDEVIRIASRLHSREMGEMRFFDHISPDGRTFSDRMEMAGFTGDLPWGENIAAGQSTPAEAVEAWMTSDEGHCEAIMNGAYHVIGVGYVRVDGTILQHYWTQNFAASH